MKSLLTTVTRAALALGLLVPLAPAGAQVPSADLAVQGRDAWAARDKKRLVQLREAALEQRHPLAAWVDYWALNVRLAEASQPELDAFYARWAGSYVEDRLRNDWLLELGRRRDWSNFRRDLAAYKMQDDREVVCYTLLAEQAQGRAPRHLRETALAAWLAQRDGDEGCAMLASDLHQAGVLKDADVWLKLRQAVEFNRPRAVRQAAALLGKREAQAITELMDKPDRALKRHGGPQGSAAELTLLALIRLAAQDPEQAQDDVRQWAARLGPEQAAWAWAQLGRASAFRLRDEAADQFERALKLQARSGQTLGWSDDTLAWAARAMLRADEGSGRPAQLLAVLALMKPAEQRETHWQYWQARAQLQLAPAGPSGETQRQQALDTLRQLASPLNYYGKLAADDLRVRLPLPAPPAPLSTPEREEAAAQPGLQRALALIALGLRNEGVREWNFSLRGLSDRQLLAAAQLACEREVWDRCINTSERTREQVDLAQRFPMPFRREVVAKADEIGLDPAYVYGLIRQESRFVVDARSSVGASGLMQVMPATARWTAKKLGLEYRPEFLHQRDFNLRVGTGYLKLVLDDFGGSQAMAAAAYNAGPNRPRRWRDGPVLDAAIWAENIPFNETRDYVKKVLANASIYAQLLGRDGSSLRERLGKVIGPRTVPETAPDLP
ncbi:lytic transglycosylase domain-containing protein [Pelomonas sp. CA6]|uniref:lytic transglycosylase domain-containing protein n=1 Tax=Pelomonas sp. CA6 TaxID=2907999 RepID=UPI001F4C3073|nr:lytic transglycosylase domain-containing protein [Pelomonas sp. CA6]MCH7343080.1 lytic transglycosylase domain-containing protein [Pelomonas sp. CA6]